MRILVSRRVLARRVRVGLPLVALLSLALYAVWPWLPFASAGRPRRTVVVYGFSILGEAMNEAVFPAFQEEWEERTGERVEMIGSFAGSGTITNQIVMGVPAQVAILSLELDAMRLVEKEVVADGSWRALPHGGVVNRTPFIVLVRPGNPLGVRDFADLTRPGVRIVHPDPLTSGGAKWAILAEYGAGMRDSPGDPDAGHRMLLGVWKNVAAQAASARAARTQYENGFGDALVTYEQEVVYDRGRGKLEGEIVYPRATILSEHTVVRVERNISESERELVGAFVDFLWSPRAQDLFVKHGFRSVDEPRNAANPAFGKIAEPFHVADFGGWQAAERDVVDAVWKTRVLPELGR